MSSSSPPTADFDKEVNKVSEMIRASLTKSCSACQSSLVSLSGGLDSSIIAHLFSQRADKKRPRGVAIIASDFMSTDLTYCQMASRAIGIPLTMYNVGTDIILEAVEETIKIIKNFNDIEIRNSVTIYLAIKWAVENGYHTLATGDGADELFAGYSFLVKIDNEKELGSQMQRIRTVMHFPSHQIGKALGVKIESPFLDRTIIELTKNIRPGLMIGEQKGKRYGKWILRKAFEDKITRRIIWRPKSPMQDGSGTSGLTGLFDSITSNEKYTEKKSIIEKEDKVIIKSKESLYYYEIFKDMFGLPVNVQKVSKDADYTQQKSCPYCRCFVGNTKFCRMCAAFPI